MQQRRRMIVKNEIFESFYLVLARDGNSSYKNKAKKKINTVEKKIIDFRMKKEKDLRKIEIPERESSAEERETFLKNEKVVIWMFVQNVVKWK
jgi:hypothetical protein